MGATVLGEYFVVQILDTEAQAGDADLSDRLEFSFGQGARFTLEGDLLSRVPRHELGDALDKTAQVTGADVRGCTAAEVDELERPPGSPGSWL